MNDSYPFKLSLLGHKERLNWLIGAYDRVTNVVSYAEERAAKHAFAAQDGRYIQGILVELINYHKAEIAKLEET